MLSLNPSLFIARHATPWEEEKLVGESETPILGELISPKSSKTPRRNQEITNGGLGVALTVET
jgi:hypothetical protein